MQLIDILARDRVVADVRVSSKKRLLEHLAKLLAGDLGGRIERAIFEALIARESARRLAALGGTQPALAAIPRRRSTASRST